jgi:antitoxin component of RelBE/YafQ-DinJ toxin-antitoxin module
MPTMTRKRTYYDKHVSVLLDEDTHNRFLQLCDDAGLTSSSFLRQMVKRIVDEHEQETAA